MELVTTASLTFGSRPCASGLAAIFAAIDSRLNSDSGIGPMMPSSLRSGHR
ncbi:hypothetical protein D9M71_569010 [compost metagenome]